MIDMVFLLLLFFLVNAVIIETKLDSNVQVSVADQAKKAEILQGRIVINVYSEGSIFDDSGGVLANENELFAYLSEEKKKNDEKGFPSSLFLRADRNCHFRDTRKVIKVAGRAGIGEMITSAFVTSK